LSDNAPGSGLFTVLFSTRPEREDSGMPALYSCAAHAAIIMLIVWGAHGPTLPRSSMPADGFDPMDSNINTIMLTHEKIATPKRATGRPAAGKRVDRPVGDGMRFGVASVPELQLPDATAVGVVLSTHMDSLEQAVHGFEWAIPGVPGGDGIGGAGGDADVNVLAASEPRYRPYSRAPVLRNAEDIRKFLSKKFPYRLRQQGGAVRAILWLLVDASGQVVKSITHESSGRKDTDQLAVAASLRMTFDPAENGGMPIAVWVQQPVTFRVLDE
jgi:TonB family protein